MRYLCLTIILILTAKSVVGQSVANKDPLKIIVGISVGPSRSEAFGSLVAHQLEPYHPFHASYGKPTITNEESISVQIHSKFAFHRFLYAKSGLGLLTKGAVIKNVSFTYPLKISSTYLTIPLVLGFNTLGFIPGNEFSLSIEGGLSPGIAVVQDPYSPGPGGPVNDGGKTRNFVIAGHIGADLHFAITKNFFLTGNYSRYRDLNPVYTFPDDKDYDVFFKGYYLTAGLAFVLK